MCIIAVRPKNKTIDDETFRNCFENNPDGCGFMYVKNGIVYGRKGIMDFKEFLRENKRIPKDVAVVYHFRIQTHGGVTPKLTHPFPVTNNFEKMHKLEWWNDYGVAHNGIFNTVKAPEGESDTEVFIANVLKPLQELSKHKDNMLTDKFYDDIINSAVGGSKLAIMDKTGFVKMYGYGWVNGSDGCYYSNTTYSYSKVDYYKYWYEKYEKDECKNECKSNTPVLKEKTVSVMVIGEDEINGKSYPSYVISDGCAFVDKEGYIYYYDDINECFRKSVFKSNAIFNDEESLDIKVKEY